MSEPNRRIKVTLAVDDEEPIEAEQDLLPEDDPILVAQRMVAGLLRLRNADTRRRS